MHVDFYADGVSSMTPDREILSGRPFGGLGIMWRKSLGSCITIEKYDDHRLMAVQFDNGSCTLLAVNIYMPYDDRSVRSSNYDEYMNYLWVVHAIIQESAASNIMIIGDWNANVNTNAISGAELISFCDEHGYIISDVDKLGLESGAFTYLSESHGTTSWLDHCVCTVQAHAAVSSLEINYDVHSSDHFPLSICVDVNNIPKVETTMQHSTVKCNWGKATERQLSEYTTNCETLLRSDVSLDCEAIYCKNTACSDPNHKHSIEKLYGSIVSSLHNAADGIIPTNNMNNGSGPHAIPGWNERVKSAHALARDAFKFWITSGKARQGTEYEEMKTSRSNFKYILRMCKRQESTTKADSLANDLIGKDQKSFWRHVSKHSRKSPPLANNVEGATGHVDITNMWHDHFKGLLNCVDNITHREYVLDSIGDMPTQYDLFTPVEIKSAIESLKGNKASGTDNVFAEHLKHAGAKIHVLLSICFNACMVHGCLPSTMTDTILVPIIKDKTGNASSKANYRPIALTSVLSKVFETALLSKLESVFETSDYQFGFKSHHSTDLCIYTLKEIVEYYKSHSTSVYVCFMDASKAFDRVNHWTLFKKMIDSGMPPIFVRLIVTWYCEQRSCVSIERVFNLA